MHFRPLSPAQMAVLAALDVDVYQRRQLPRLAPAPPAKTSLVTWSDADINAPLARAIARASRMVDARQWSSAWQAAHLILPDLAHLRENGAAKRALWRLIRGRLST